MPSYSWYWKLHFQKTLDWSDLNFAYLLHTHKQDHAENDLLSFWCVGYSVEITDTSHEENFDKSFFSDSF